MATFVRRANCTPG